MDEDARRRDCEREGGPLCGDTMTPHPAAGAARSRSRAPRRPDHGPCRRQRGLGHLSEMLALRADHTIRKPCPDRDDDRSSGDAAGALAALHTGAKALRGPGQRRRRSARRRRAQYLPQRERTGRSVHRGRLVVSQELAHHGAEIALLRDLCCARRPGEGAGSPARGPHDAVVLRNGVGLAFPPPPHRQAHRPGPRPRARSRVDLGVAVTEGRARLMTPRRPARRTESCTAWRMGHLRPAAHCGTPARRSAPTP